MSVEILHRITKAVLYSSDGTDIKAALVAAVASGANLRDADLRGADLRGANLGYANLRDADLRGADLRSANLGYADLRDADLRGADLRSANLGDAELRRADLGSADLRGANLGGADLRGAKNLTPECVTSLLMLLDQPGRIRSYKLVTAAGVGPFNGGIKYEIGKTYEEPHANTDVMQQCAAGLNVATLDWCLKEWREGYRVLMVEFTAQDIAAIPTATDGKFRVRRLTVVGEKDIMSILAKVEPVEAA